MFKATLLVAVLGGAAWAEPGGAILGAQDGRVIISADRLVPLFTYSSLSESSGNNSTTTKTSSFSLLWNGYPPTDGYDIPRIAVDYTVAPRVSIGGSVLLTLPFSSSRETKQNGATTSMDEAKTTIYGVALRAGYLLPVGDKMSFWPRGGLQYFHVGTSSPGTPDSTASVSQLALNLEPSLLYALGTSFGIVAGLAVDIPLTGGRHNQTVVAGTTISTDNDASQFHVGLTIGLCGWI